MSAVLSCISGGAKCYTAFAVDCGADSRGNAFANPAAAARAA
jgi:hypothetical protein